MSTTFSYGKKEKIKSRKLIETLFTKGKSVTNYPVKLFYSFEKKIEEKAVLQTGVGVSKKHFKSAVKRNRIKRLLREANRLQNKELKKIVSAKNENVYLFFIYVSKEMENFATIETKIKNLLEIITQKYIEQNS